MVTAGPFSTRKRSQSITIKHLPGRALSQLTVSSLAICVGFEAKYSFCFLLIKVAIILK